MTVKIPMMNSVRGTGIHSGYPTRDWRNFCISLIVPNSGAVPYDYEIKKALKEWNAVWLRGQGMLEFETEKDLTMWLLRWS